MERTNRTRPDRTNCRDQLVIVEEGMEGCRRGRRSAYSTDRIGPHPWSTAGTKDSFVDDLQPMARHAGPAVPAPTQAPAATVADVREAGHRITANIERVIEGKQSTVSVGLAVLLA